MWFTKTKIMFNIDRLITLYNTDLEQWRIYLRENMPYFINYLKRNSYYWFVKSVEDLMSDLYMKLDEKLQNINPWYYGKQHTSYLKHWCNAVIKNYIADTFNYSIRCPNYKIEPIEVSLNTPDCEYTTDDIMWIKDTRDEMEKNEINSTILRQLINQVFSDILTHTEQIIINMRYMCNKKYTYTEVWEMVWLNGKYIPYLERKILKRIKIYLDHLWCKGL